MASESASRILDRAVRNGTLTLRQEANGDYRAAFFEGDD